MVRCSRPGPTVSSTLTGNLTFDAKGNPSAVFVVKIGGALNAAAGVHVILANGAQAVNIYWRVDGAVSVLDNSIFKGTIISNGAIHLYGGTTLEGRALALVGAVTMASNVIQVPTNGGGIPNSLIVVRPASGDSIQGGTQNYQITWAGTGIDSTKTFDYSLDGGTTWKLIATIKTGGFLFNWNVPDTASNRAVIRITDKNSLSGKSGLFTITSSKSSAGSIVVVTPATGEIVNAKTQNYQITWTGSNIASKKTFDYSLDGGLSWTLIGSITADTFKTSWNVPDTASTMAMVRITDGNGVVGKSGLFVIKSGKPGLGSIVVVHPAAGETLQGGSQNYMITWTGTNIAPLKTFEYSLDGGANWTVIGVMRTDQFSYNWPNIPNVATSQALVRITDSNNVIGTSGLFTITMSPGIGSINSLTLTGLDNNKNIGNNKTLGINWTYTPDIGSTVALEYSLDYTVTWHNIATLAPEAMTTNWVTPATGYDNPVFIRITSSKGMTRLSEPFSIGTTGAVAFTSKSGGYALAHYPNPASGQTNISFVLPTAGDVTITITDAVGREVATVITSHVSAGTHTVPFNASALAEGTYNYTLRTGATTLVGKMMVVR
jgi:hypothetical protein